MGENSTEENPDSVLFFWFGKLESATDSADARSKIWFRKSKETDRIIRERFGMLVERALTHLLDWSSTPEALLARVLVLDQFTRNIFRDTPRAFAGDEMAQNEVVSGIEKLSDLQLLPIQRAFFYMPLMHAEDLELQDLCIEKFATMLRTCSGGAKDRVVGFHKSALAHRNIVQRFGRFPHRNQILGRRSSEEEIEFLKGPGSSF